MGLQPFESELAQANQDIICSPHGLALSNGRSGGIAAVRLLRHAENSRFFAGRLDSGDEFQRLRDLRHLRRRRESFARGREDVVGFDGAGGGLVEFGELQRRQQAEAARALLVRDGDGGEVGLLRGSRDGRDRPSAGCHRGCGARAGLPSVRLSVWLAPALLRSARRLQPSRLLTLELGEEALIERRVDAGAQFDRGRQGLTQFRHACVVIAKPRVRPGLRKSSACEIVSEPGPFGDFSDNVHVALRGRDHAASRFGHHLVTMGIGYRGAMLCLDRARDRA